MTNGRPTVGIVGGGILGMTLATRLDSAGYSSTILESAPASGGLAAPADIGGYTWDRFYHVILASDRRLLALLDELGLAPAVRWGTTRTGFYTGGRLYSLSNNLEFLRFPPLSLAGKIRLGATVFYASRIRNWRRLEAIPVDRWLTRCSGREVFERIWLPLLRSKLGENHARASAAFIWAIIARMYAARRSGMKRERLGYVDGGYDVVLRRFQAELDRRGIETATGRRVAAVENRGDGVAVSLADGTARRFDAAVMTVPCPRVADLCPQLSDAERARLRGVVYQGVVCASVLLRKPLAGFYVTNITDGWVPFTGVIEMTALVDRERFGGHSLVYLPRYLAQDDAFWSRGDAEIEREFLDALARMYPAFRREDVLAFKVARAREVLAVSTLRYSDERLPPVRTSVPNLFVVNSAQIAAGTLNVDETLGVAHAGADELLGLLRARATAPEGVTCT